MVSSCIKCFLLVQSVHATCTENSTNCRSPSFSDVSLVQHYAGKKFSASKPNVKQEELPWAVAKSLLSMEKPHQALGSRHRHHHSRNRDIVTSGKVGLTGLDEELAYLSGSMHHSMKLTQDLGWSTRATVGVGGTDHMTVFKKGSTCAVGFSGTDDEADTFLQFLGVLSPTDLCGFSGVNPAYAEELSGYLQDNKTFPLAMQELGECDEIYATGWSAGGSVASLFAACANKGAVGLDLGVSVKLVTFAAPAASQTRLYSGTEDGTFEGTRYTIASSWEKAPEDLYIEWFALVVGVFNGYGGTEAAQKYAATKQALIDNKDTAAFWEILNDATGGEGFEQVYMTLIQAGLTGADMGLTAFCQKWSDSFFVYYDGVPSLWKPWGFDHPLMDVGYLANPNGGPPPPSSWGVSPAPNYAYITYFMAIATNYMYFPNHGICCYIGGKDSILNPGDECAAMFTMPLFVDCAIPFTRVPGSTD